MTLCDLYTTVAISDLNIRHYYSLELSNTVTRFLLWSFWVCLPVGLACAALKKKRAGLILLSLGFVFAFAVLEFDAHFPRRLQADIANSWDFDAGYGAAYLAALLCAAYLFGRKTNLSH
jgi:hypothetical protein